MKEENIKSEYQRKVDKSLIPTCNIMGVNIAAINMNWLLKYIDENLSDIKGDYICVSNVHTTVTSYEDSEVFKNMFYSHYTIRPSCYKCPYKDIMHPADITIADFWKIDSAIPGFNDDKGVSLVLINNEKGEKVFDLIKKDLIYQTSTVEKCMMSTMQRPFSKPEDREEFWDSYLKKDFDFMAKKYGEYGLINVFKRSFKLGIGRVYRRIRKY